MSGDIAVEKLEIPYKHSTPAFLYACWVLFLTNKESKERWAIKVMGFILALLICIFSRSPFWLGVTVTIAFGGLIEFGRSIHRIDAANTADIRDRRQNPGTRTLVFDDQGYRCCRQGDTVWQVRWDELYSYIDTLRFVYIYSVDEGDVISKIYIDKKRLSAPETTALLEVLEKRCI